MRIANTIGLVIGLLACGSQSGDKPNTTPGGGSGAAMGAGADAGARNPSGGATSGSGGTSSSGAGGDGVSPTAGTSSTAGTNTGGTTNTGGSMTARPDDLRVGDRARALNVEGPPLFSWLPHDGAGDQVQTAYQIQVNRESSGELAWDSGKIPSSQQSYVPYAGTTALMPGESYTWKVRTWNRGDAESEWSAAAAFDTALTNTAQGWGASRIRRTTSGAADAADEYTLARVEKAIGASPVKRARAYISASHQFELRLNGMVVDRGPAFAYPGEEYYQASDVTALARAGQPLAVGVIYHWYGSGQGRPAGEPALIVRVVVDHEDGSRETIVTDNTWRVQRAAQWQTGAPKRNPDSGDYVEWMDLREVPTGWDMPGFAATGWQTPVVSSFRPLRAQEPRLRNTTLNPVSVRTLGDGAVVADFGVVIPARPVVRFASGMAGRTLTLQAGYRLTPDGHVSAVPATTQGSNLSFRVVQRAGAQEFRPMTHFGFRYLQISAPGETLGADAISAIVEHTDAPAGRAAEFESSDMTLNSVFALVQRSAIYSVQQQFVDTPTREKAQFLGDAAAISYATMAGHRERDATQKAISEFISSQARFWPDGRVNAVYPNGDGGRDIPDYTEMFSIWVWRYYLETGDRTLLERAYPVMEKIAGYISAHRNATTGLITNLAGGTGDYLYGIVDWPLRGRFGYDMTTTARTTVNILAVGALRATAAAAEVLAQAGDVTTYTMQAEQLTAAINMRLRRADGIYIDGSTGSAQSTHASQHANSYAIAFGVTPAAERAAVVSHIAGLGMQQGPMTAHWLAKAFGDAERYDALLSLLTNRTNPGWANILSQGGTFTWEAWDSPSTATSESESHGWGAQVVVDILEYLLGVRVIGPGAAVVGIRPPKTGLSSARGTVHTERGPVKVDWSRQGTTGLTLSVDVPMNVRAQVALPASDVAMTTGTGAGAPRHRETSAGWVIYEAGSGHSSFSVQ